jgi:biopolymer transport protein ExbB/TolQ
LDRTVDAANLGAPTGDLSLITLFLQADIVVKLVMLLLLVASVWVWAIVFEKITSLRRVNRLAAAFEDRFWSGGSLEDLYDQEGVRPADGRRVRRRHGRMASLFAGGGRGHGARQRARPDRPGDERDRGA